MHLKRQAAAFTANAAEEDIWSDRYSRQVRFAPIGAEGQQRLSEACVLIVGAGALGASLAQHMTRAGVGEIRLADRDFVEPSNLQRQMLFEEADALAALPKAVAAAAKLGRINRQLSIVPHVVDVNEHNVSELVRGADLVLDGTDNGKTRLLMSDECFKQGIPFIYGGIVGSRGMSAALIPQRTACLRCLLDEEADEGENCDIAGVISPAVELVASLQSVEALKWLSGNRDDMRRTWISADVWSFGLRESRLPAPFHSCPHCGGGIEAAASGGEDETADESAVVLCGRDTIQVTLSRELPLADTEKALTFRGCSVVVNPYLVKALLPTGEGLVAFPSGRVLVQGASGKERAVQLCRDYLLAGL